MLRRGGAEPYSGGGGDGGDGGWIELRECTRREGVSALDGGDVGRGRALILGERYVSGVRFIAVLTSALASATAPAHGRRQRTDCARESRCTS